MTASAVDGFIDRLAAVPAGPDWTNFYDHGSPANALRPHYPRTSSTDMLEPRPGVRRVGETPGLRGVGVTGGPFTKRATLEGPSHTFRVPGAGAG